MLNKKIIFCIIITLCSFYIVFSEAPDWPGWRGQDRNSISTDTDWDPVKINGEPVILWKINVGAGFSAFAIKDDYLYTIGNAKKIDTIWCINIKTGKKIWTYSYDCSYGQYPGPRSTPLVDGDLVYTMSEKGNIFCLDAKTGKVKWKKNAVTDFKANLPSWDLASSPVIEGDILYLNICKYGIALNKITGKKKWSSPSGTSGYASPVFARFDNVDSLVMFGQKAVYGVNRANGKLLWEYGWVTDYDVNAADPVFSGNTVLVSSAYNVGCALIKIDNFRPSLVWKSKVIRSHFSSIILRDGYIYGNDGSPGSSRGSFKCIKLDSGDEMWSKTLGFGGLVATNDYLIMLTERGKLHIAKLSPEKYVEIAQASVLTSTCWTPPVLAKGRIFCRNHRGDIVCVDVSKKK